MKPLRKEHDQIRFVVKTGRWPQLEKEGPEESLEVQAEKRNYKGASSNYGDGSGENL